MRTLVEDYDIVVVGAGHAGCEAALAGARLGLNTVMFTVSVDSIALMPCNPNVGARRGISSGRLMHLEARWEKTLTRPLSSPKCLTVPKDLQCTPYVRRLTNRHTAMK